jgi:hypothetical protein
MLFGEVCSLLGIHKTRTTPFHPKSDGMVERFNQTLATMLTAYVSEHQNDWDSHLPYILMTYRSAEHDSTGYTPNMSMYGREATTPLDIMFSLPEHAKHVSRTEWVCDLRQKLEDAHEHARTSTKSAMLRQKKYHDSKLSYEQFQAGDQVYVYFPQRKVGISPKLMSFWRGPFTVTSKFSDVTYKVCCGRKGKEQVIHVDRMRICNPQKLSGEVDTSGDLAEVATDDLVDVIDSCFADSFEIEQHSSARPQRQRKHPVWMNDFDCAYTV